VKQRAVYPMHILFIDESGTPPSPDKPKNKYFVIGGVIIPEDQWHSVRDALMGMKVRRRLRGELKWRYFAPGNDDDANPMRKLSQPERDSVREEIYHIITNHRFVRSIVCVASVEAAFALPSIQTREDLYLGTYKPVSERFQYYLQDLSRTNKKTEYGIVVTDHRGAEDDHRFRLHHQKLLYSPGKSISTYRNLIEGLFVHPSNMSVGIQLADLVASAVWRKFERNDDRWYRMAEPSFRRSSKGVVDGYGLVRFPKDGWVYGTPGETVVPT